MTIFGDIFERILMTCLEFCFFVIETGMHLCISDVKKNIIEFKHAPKTQTIFLFFALVISTLLTRMNLDSMILSGFGIIFLFQIVIRYTKQYCDEVDLLNREIQ